MQDTYSVHPLVQTQLIPWVTEVFQTNTHHELRRLQIPPYHDLCMQRGVTAPHSSSHRHLFALRIT
jgi:hypothetical protein